MKSKPKLVFCSMPMPAEVVKHPQMPWMRVLLAILCAGLWVLPHDAAQAKKCADYPEDHPVRQIPYCQSELPPKQGDGFLSDLINLPNTVVKDAADAVLGRSREPDTEQASESDETGTMPEAEQERAEVDRPRQDRKAESVQAREVPLRREPVPAESAAIERVRARLSCAETSLEQGEMHTKPTVLPKTDRGLRSAVKFHDAETGEFLFAVWANCTGEFGQPATWRLAGEIAIGDLQ